MVRDEILPAAAYSVYEFLSASAAPSEKDISSDPEAYALVITASGVSVETAKLSIICASAEYDRALPSWMILTDEWIQYLISVTSFDVRRG